MTYKVYDTAYVYTWQVTFYKVPEKHGHVYLFTLYTLYMYTDTGWPVKHDRVFLIVVKSEFSSVQWLILDNSLHTRYQKNTAMFIRSPCTSNELHFMQRALSFSLCFAEILENTKSLLNPIANSKNKNFPPYISILEFITISFISLFPKK